MNKMPVWLKSFLLAFVLLFGVGVLIVTWIIGNKEPSVASNTQPVQTQYQAQPSEEMSVLIGFCRTRTDPVDKLLIAEVDTYQNAVTLVDIPLELDSMVDNKTMSLADAYTYGGMSTAKKAVEDLLFIDVDRVARIDDAGLTACVDYLGGIEWDVDKAFTYQDANANPLWVSTGRQMIDGRRFCGMIRQGDCVPLFCALGQQCLDEGFSASTEKALTLFANSSDTDISAYDIAFLKNGVAQMMIDHNATVNAPQIQTEQKGERLTVTDETRRQIGAALGTE